MSYRRNARGGSISSTRRAGQIARGERDERKSDADRGRASNGSAGDDADWHAADQATGGIDARYTNQHTKAYEQRAFAEDEAQHASVVGTQHRAASPVRADDGSPSRRRRRRVPSLPAAARRARSRR